MAYDIADQPVELCGLRARRCSPVTYARIRYSTALRPSSEVLCVGLHKILVVRSSEESFRTVVPDALEGKRVGCFLGEPTCRHPTLPCPPCPAALPCAALPRLARGIPGFWIRQVMQLRFCNAHYILFYINFLEESHTSNYVGPRV